MSRGERAAYNMASNILSQVVSMICGFILPRLILTAFGSSYNGITSSISQFLSIVALLRGGVGGATRVALYKSLAQKDLDQVSATIKATEIFMRKIAYIFGACVIVFSCFYPFLVNKEFSWIFSSTLVLIISISTFIQYYFGITYQFLLQADQRHYIISFLDMAGVIVNTILSVILIKSGFGIHGVKLGSTIAYSIMPITLHVYCHKHYKIKKNIKPDFSSISQRWDAFWHQLAGFVHSNTDIAILTVFTSTKLISVYTTYYLVGNGLRKFLMTIATGVESAFGDIIAKNETDALQSNIEIYECMIHVLTTAIFGAAFILIVPFVEVYTRGIDDINYIRYSVGYLVIVCEMLYCMRSPYESLVNAAGHFKQTKKYAFAEAVLNIIVTLSLVWKYDIVGAIVGTIVAVLFRDLVYGIYTCKYIVHRPVWKVVKRFSVSGLTISCIYFASKAVYTQVMNSYFSWICYAIPITLLSFSITIITNLVFYKNETVQTGKRIKLITLSVIRRLLIR